MGGRLSSDSELSLSLSRALTQRVPQLAPPGQDAASVSPAAHMPGCQTTDRHQEVEILNSTWASRVQQQGQRLGVKVTVVCSSGVGHQPLGIWFTSVWPQLVLPSKGHCLSGRRLELAGV